MNTIRRRTAAFALGGVSLAVALTGCAAATGAPAGQNAGSGASADAGAGPAASYKDGRYTATGSYQSPGGTESVAVDVTIAKNVITAVTVTGQATDGNAVRYQKQFASGIADVVVGKSIASLKVDKVAGSSLTSGGFNDAITAIKADAAA